MTDPLFDERGPVPPLSTIARDLFPEVSVRGGALTFEDDVGDVFGPAEWFVGDEPVDFDRQRMIGAICRHRNIQHDPDQVARVAFDLLLHFFERNVVWTAPLNWASGPLARFVFREPHYQVLPHATQLGTFVSKILFWSSEPMQTDNPDSIYVSNLRCEMPNVNKVAESQVERWRVWSLNTRTVLVSTLRTGQYSDENIGYHIECNVVPDADGQPIRLCLTSCGTALFEPQPVEPSWV